MVEGPQAPSAAAQANTNQKGGSVQLFKAFITPAKISLESALEPFKFSNLRWLNFLHMKALLFTELQLILS